MIDKNTDGGNEVIDGEESELTVCSPGHPRHMDNLAGYCCRPDTDSAIFNPRCRHECCRDTWYDRHFEGSELQRLQVDRKRAQVERLRDIRKEG